jgi:hypothetical protein
VSRAAEAPDPVTRGGLARIVGGEDRDDFKTLDEINAIIERGGLSDKEVLALWECLYLSPQEIAGLLATVRANAKVDYSFLLHCIPAYTGVRRGEVIRLRWLDINFTDNYVTARSRKQSRRKKEPTRQIDLHPELRKELLAWREQRPRGQYGVGLAVVDAAYYIPINHRFADGGALRPNQLPLGEVLSVLRLQDKDLINHNSKFERKWLSHHGHIETRVVWDTMIAARLLRCDRSAELKDVAARELDVPDWDLRMVHEALLVLHSKTVVVRRADAKHQGQVTERVVHLLDAYGYVYERGGKEVDLHDLPRGSTKINIGSDDRPVWRIRQTTEDGERFERPAGILYRLNTELADELIHKQGTIGFTVMARKVFGLFKRYRKNPAAIRLILLILRQTGPEFLRRLDRLVSDLGFDETNRRRAVEQLTGVLASLKDARLVKAFEVSQEAEVLRVQVNRDSYQEEAASGEGG